MSGNGVRKEAAQSVFQRFSHRFFNENLAGDVGAGGKPEAGSRAERRGSRANVQIKPSPGAEDAREEERCERKIWNTRTAHVGFERAVIGNQ